MKKVILSLMVIAAIALFAGSALAATATSDFQVNAYVEAVCSVSTTPVSFGTVASQFATAQGDISVQCPSGTIYSIALDAGMNLRSSGYRGIANGTNTSPYVLCKDAGLVNEWGDSGFANTYLWGTSLSDTGNGALQPHTVYGRMEVDAVVAGSYTDTVTVTVHY